jgi:sodium/proline symporter
MKLDRTDLLVAAVTAATLLAAIGMLFDVWQAVYYSIPAFVLLFMLLGSLNARDEWSPGALVPVVGLWLVLAGLFVAAGALLGSSGELGGLPVSTGIFLYLIWPISTIGASLVYAVVYTRWLAHDLPAAGEGARP